MDYLSNELIESTKHYNQLNLKEKFEVCQFWDGRATNIQSANFEGSFRRLFENAKKMKHKYYDIYQFGFIEEIPDHVDFRSMTDKQFATLIKELYCLKNLEKAKFVSEALGIMSKDQKDGEILRLNDLIKEMCLELDIKEKEIRDQADTIRHFVRAGKLLNSEYYNKLNEERAIDKPETKVYSRQFIQGE